MLPIDGVEQIQEEKSYGSETIEDRQISQQQFLPIEEVQNQQQRSQSETMAPPEAPEED